MCHVHARASCVYFDSSLFLFSYQSIIFTYHCLTVLAYDSYFTAQGVLILLPTSVARPGGGPPTLAKRAMRNDADEGSSLPISMPEGFRNPDAEGPTKKQRMSAWVDSTLSETAVATVAGIAR